MDLVRDMLDKKVVDRNGREMGRVDSIVLRVDAGRPPSVVALELGPAVLAARVRPLFGRWVAALEHGFGVSEGRPFRIPISGVLRVHDNQVKVDAAFGETPAATVEQRLRRWVASIPRSS
jgi:sporulation protein YlmC with PRC-barrel domain